MKSPLCPGALSGVGRVCAKRVALGKSRRSRKDSVLCMLRWQSGRGGPAALPKRPPHRERGYRVVLSSSEAGLAGRNAGPSLMRRSTHAAMARPRRTGVHPKAVLSGSREWGMKRPALLVSNLACASSVSGRCQRRAFEAAATRALAVALVAMVFVVVAVPMTPSLIVIGWRRCIRLGHVITGGRGILHRRWGDVYGLRGDWVDVAKIRHESGHAHRERPERVAIRVRGRKQGKRKRRTG